MSDFNKIGTKGTNANNGLIFPRISGPLSVIDRKTALSKGEAPIHNHQQKGQRAKKDSIVAIFSGTKVETVIEH